MSQPAATATARETTLLAGSVGLLLLVALAASVAEGAGVLALLLMLAAAIGCLVLLRPEWGVILLTSTFFLSYPEALQGSGSLTINNLLGLVLGVILFIRAVIDRRVDFLSSRQVRLLLVVAFVVLVNQLLVEQAPPTPGFERLDLTAERMHDVLSKLAYLLFVVAFVRERWQVVVLVGAVVLFVVVTAPNAVWNALTAWNAPMPADIEKLRATASIGVVAARNANRLAFMAAIAIALIGFAALEFRSGRALVLAAPVVSLLVVTIFLSGSRSGLLNLLILGAFFAARLPIRPRRLLIGGMVAAVLIVAALSLVPGDSVSSLTGGEPVLRRRAQALAQRAALPEAYLQRITSFILPEHATGGVSESTDKRLELLSIGARMALDHPLTGVGLGNYRWVSIVDYGNRRESALHNSYMLALVEGGLLLLVPYLALFVVTWKALAISRRHAVQRPQVGLGWLVEATRTILIMFLVFSLFADLWHEVYLYFFVALSVILGRLYAAAEGPA